MLADESDVEGWTQAVGTSRVCVCSSRSCLLPLPPLPALRRLHCVQAATALPYQAEGFFDLEQVAAVGLLWAGHEGYVLRTQW